MNFLEEMSSKKVLSCCLLGSVSCEYDVEKSFADFQLRFNKNYSNGERAARLEHFKSNLMKAAEAHRLCPSATFGVTKFSDLTEDEFSVRLGLKYPNGWKHTAPSRLFSDEELASVPDSADWRQKGAVTPVKDQGHCGSCWSFSATGNIEGQHFMATGKLVALSEQELVSCDFDDSGCKGGLMDQAFGFISKERSGELVTESWYPYKSGDGTTRGCGGVSGAYPLCRGLSGSATDAWCTQFCYNAQGKALCTADLCDCSSTGAHVGATISSFTDLPKNEDQLAAWLAQNGPISIGVAVPLGSVWQGYTGGIMTASVCPASSPNHGVLLVGFSKNEKYWIVKNSWGANFGESGYIRLQYGTNTCNLVFSPSSSQVSTAILA